MVMAAVVKIPPWTGTSFPKISSRRPKSPGCWTQSRGAARSARRSLPAHNVPAQAARQRSRGLLVRRAVCHQARPRHAHRRAALAVPIRAWGGRRWSARPSTTGRRLRTRWPARLPPKPAGGTQAALSRPLPLVARRLGKAPPTQRLILLASRAAVAGARTVRSDGCWLVPHSISSGFRPLVSANRRRRRRMFASVRALRSS